MTVEHRTRLIGPLFLFLFFAAPALAAETRSFPEDTQTSFADEIFVVQTTEEDAAASLDRISGDIDRGFAAEEYTYKSEHHGKAGPFSAQEDSYDAPRAY